MHAKDYDMHVYPFPCLRRFASRYSSLFALAPHGAFSTNGSMQIDICRQVSIGVDRRLSSGCAGVVLLTSALISKLEAVTLRHHA